MKKKFEDEKKMHKEKMKKIENDILQLSYKKYENDFLIFQKDFEN
jgi:hypothetical protein